MSVHNLRQAVHCFFFIRQGFCEGAGISVHRWGNDFVQNWDSIALVKLYLLRFLFTFQCADLPSTSDVMDLSLSSALESKRTQTQTWVLTFSAMLQALIKYALFRIQNIAAVLLLAQGCFSNLLIFARSRNRLIISKCALTLALRSVTTVARFCMAFWSKDSNATVGNLKFFRIPDFRNCTLCKRCELAFWTYWYSFSP